MPHQLHSYSPSYRTCIRIVGLFIIFISFRYIYLDMIYRLLNSHIASQLTRDIEPILAQCWVDVVDGGPTLNQHWFNVSCLLGLWYQDCFYKTFIDNLDDVYGYFTSYAHWRLLWRYFISYVYTPLLFISSLDTFHNKYSMKYDIFVLTFYLRFLITFSNHIFLNPLSAKLFNLNFHPLEVVSRWRDPQLKVSENYSDLTKWRSTVFKSCWLMSHFIFNMSKRWYLMC